MFSWHPHDRQVLAFGIQKSLIFEMYLNDMAFLYLQAPNTSNICKSFTRNGNLLGLHIFGTYD